VPKKRIEADPVHSVKSLVGCGSIRCGYEPKVADEAEREIEASSSFCSR